MRRLLLALAGLIGSSSLYAQELNDESLRGTYFYTRLRVSLTEAGGVLEPGGASGRAVFDGNGTVAYTDRSGRYMVSGNGFLTLPDPADGVSTITGRIGKGATMILGSSAGSATVYDLFAAVKGPSEAVTPAILSGTYQAVVLQLDAARTSSARSASATFRLADTSVQLSPDGTGTLSLPTTTALPVRDYTIQVSGNGDFILGTPRSGGTGLFVAARSATSEASGMYWIAEMAVEPGRVSSSLGSLAINGERARVSQRWAAPGGPYDYRGVNLTPQDLSYATGAQGALLGARSTGDLKSILIAVPAPAFSGDGVFLHPYGVVDSASLSPIGNPLAPRAFVSLFGTGLAPRLAAAQSVPLPLSLDGVSVEVNGQAAALHFVSPSQINFLTPGEFAGAEVRIAVRNNGAVSNIVTAPVASSSPAVFSVDGSGSGQGIVTHADFSLVTASAPGRPGEVVVLFVSGLGGTARPARVWFGGRPAEVLYSGPSPAYPGLDQVNARIPALLPAGSATPVTLVTAEGFSDTTEIPVRP